MTNDPVPAIEKRLARGRVARYLEDAGSWDLNDDYKQQTIRSPASQSFWITIWMAAITAFTSAVWYGEEGWTHPETMMPLFTVASGIWAALNVYFTIIPTVLRIVYKMPRNLADEQRQAAKEYETLSLEDRAQARSAFYEFVRMDPKLQHDKYYHKHDIWIMTLQELSTQHKLEHKLELQTPTDAEQALAALTARNKEIQHELKELA